MGISIGDRFGRLTVVSLPKTKTRTRDYATLRCECGKEATVLVANLFSGRTKSCGCLYLETCRNRNIKDLAGKRFERLLVLDRTERRTGGGRVFWHVRCDCGVEKEVSSASLIRGITKSCGCLNKERARRGFAPGEAAKLYVLRNYLKGAKRRNLPWGLTEDLFYDTIQLPCHYCGVAPSLSPGDRTDKMFMANGVDRVDSNLGYLPTNIVPCCTFCQYAKRDLSYSDFLRHLQRVSEFGIWKRQ